MYQRLKASLINPKSLVNYVKDKFIIVLCYILIFALLFAVPYIASIKNLGTSLVRKYKQTFPISEVIEYKIENKQLVKTGEFEKTYYFGYNTNNPFFKLSLVISNSISEEFKNEHKNDFLIIYTADGVYFSDDIKSGTIKICDYEKDADLALLKDNDTDASNAFYGLIDSYVNNHKGIIYGFGIPLIYLYSITEFMFLAMMITLLSLLVYRRHHLGFGNILKMVIYSMLPQTIGLMFSLFLYGTTIGALLSDVGFIISVIYAIMALNQLARNKIIQEIEVDDNESI